MKKPVLGLFLLFVAFAVVFVAAFYATQGAAGVKFDQAAQGNFGLTQFGGSLEETKEIATTYGALAGVGFGLLAFLMGLVVFAILRAIKVPKAVAAAIPSFFCYGARLAIAIQLVWFEPKMTAWGNAIIFYLGPPLLCASAVALVLTVVFLVLGLKKTKNA